jgi:hypothetical protein
LLAPFTEEEARSTTRAMCPFNALGPDGVGPGFYAVAWISVKPALMRFLHAFHDEDVDL